jgi:hypothetical protein
MVVIVAESGARCNLIGRSRRSATTKAEAAMTERKELSGERLDQQVVKLQVESKGGRLRAERLRVECCIDEEVKLRKYNENAMSYILYSKR